MEAWNVNKHWQVLNKHPVRLCVGEQQKPPVESKGGELMPARRVSEIINFTALTLIYDGLMFPNSKLYALLQVLWLAMV